MKTNEVIKNLRNGGNLNMRDRKEKLFVKIQLNKKENGFICWQRFVAKAKGQWVNWNDYLTLKDVMKIREQIIQNNLTPTP